MYEAIDTLPFKTFQKLKLKFPVKVITLREKDFSMAGLHLMFKNHREFVEYQFRKEGIKVTRHAHDYKSLDTRDPKLGLVYMANDSVVDPGIDVYCLVGHSGQIAEEADVQAARNKV